MSKFLSQILSALIYCIILNDVSFANEPIKFACLGRGDSSGEYILVTGRYVISPTSREYVMIGNITVEGKDASGANIAIRNGRSRDFSKHKIFVGSSNNLFQLVASRNGQDNIVIRHGEGNAADDLIQVDLPASQGFEWYANQYTNAKCRFK